MKVFIFEDDSERIDVFANHFGKGNIVVTKDIPEALNILKSSSFDLIFLDRDIGHPKINGEDLAWDMCQQKVATATPVIIHSENARGQRVIKKYLDRSHKSVEVIPFRKLRYRLPT